MADHPVGMAYLLGDWATDRKATAVAGRQGDHWLISSMFDISSPTDRPATSCSDPVGMALKLSTPVSDWVSALRTLYRPCTQTDTQPDTQVDTRPRTPFLVFMLYVH